jgi:hypothetical protein
VRACVECLLATGEIVLRKRGAELPRLRAAKRVAPTPGVWRGLDLAAELRRLVALEITPACLKERPPSIELQRARPGCRMAGQALLHRRKVILYLRPTMPRAFVLATLAHEFAHIWVGPEVREFHGDHWRMTMIELIREGYGEEPDFPANESSTALDASCEKALARALRRRRKNV